MRTEGDAQSHGQLELEGVIVKASGGIALPALTPGVSQMRSFAIAQESRALSEFEAKRLVNLAKIRFRRLAPTRIVIMPLEPMNPDAGAAITNFRKHRTRLTLDKPGQNRVV
ncbi:MAG: hypothetical protein RMK20_02845 [Verrucomicrobiales bacterium]|nr:hypothetical protein [Verrucomicrobiales bacterium]